MQIQYASDLHIEFKNNRKYLIQNPLPNNGDVLILAGDIVPIIAINKFEPYFKYLSDRFEQVFWIPGNHEYYHFDISKNGDSFHKIIFGNIHLINNKVIELNGVDFIFSTLWTKISQERRFNIQSRLNDFHVIVNNQTKLNVEAYNKMHDNCKSFIINSLERKGNKKSVVVTHHVPTLLSYPPQYIGSELIEAIVVDFFSELEVILQPDYWIFGHSHVNVNNFKSGKTTFLTNQLGYVQYEENKGFEGGKIVTI